MILIIAVEAYHFAVVLLICGSIELFEFLFHLSSLLFLLFQSDAPGFFSLFLVAALYLLSLVLDLFPDAFRIGLAREESLELVTVQGLNKQQRLRDSFERRVVFLEQLSGLRVALL